VHEDNIVEIKVKTNIEAEVEAKVKLA